MNKYLFFTGEGCSGCTVLKNHIRDNKLQDCFVIIDVGEEPAIAASDQVRTLPVIVSPSKQYYIGLSGGIELIKTMTRNFNR